MTKIHLIISDGSEGTIVTAFSSAHDRDAAYVDLIETLLEGEAFDSPDEAHSAFMEKRPSPFWNCYTSDVPLIEKGQL